MNPYPAIIFCSENVCFLCLLLLRLDFFVEANIMYHDLGSYCLQYRLSKNISRREEQTMQVVTGGLRVKRGSWI